MIKNEIYKLFIKNKLILYFILLLILKAVFLANISPCINTDIELVSDSYKSYISKFEGKLTQNSDKISQDYSEILRASEEYTDLKSNYESNLIDADTYVKKSDELNEKLKNADVVSLANEALEFVKEKTAQRWLMYTNGWEAFIANERLDYVLISSVILFILFLFTLDYETGAYNIINSTTNGRTNAFYNKQIMMIVYIILINIILTSEEMLFYNIKYGLSNFNAPIQSLISFRESPLNISIIEAVIIITIFKIFGCILLANISILLSLCLKKLWIAASCSGLIVFIPYAIFNNKIERYYFQPLGVLLGNGYLKGKCEYVLRDGVLISEPFQGIDLNILYIILFCISFASFILFTISLRFYMLNKKVVNFKQAVVFVCNISAFIILCTFIHFFSKGENVIFNSIYSKGMGFSDEKYCYFSDKALIAVNYSTGETFNIIRDVIKDKSADFYYVSAENIYYLKKNNDSGEINYYSIDKSDYNEKLIYKEIKGFRSYRLDSKYLGLINAINIDNVTSDYYEKDEIQNFWIDGKYIFTVDSNGVNMINVDNKKSRRIIEKNINPECIVYSCGKIYYSDIMNEVYSYDVESRVQKKLNIEKCFKLFIANGELIVVDFDYNVGIYRNDNIEYVSDVNINPTSYVSSNNNALIFVNNTNQVVQVNPHDLSSEILIKDITAYNVVAFENTSKVYVYTQIENELLWELIDLYTE